jgi:hypothetical protein
MDKYYELRDASKFFFFSAWLLYLWVCSHCPRGHYHSAAICSTDREQVGRQASRRLGRKHVLVHFPLTRLTFFCFVLCLLQA